MPTGPASHRRTLTLICVLWTAVVCALHVGPAQYRQAEQAARDWLETNRAARLSSTNPQIVLLAIDEPSRSLDTLFAEDLAKSPTLQLMKKGFPWNRAVYADIIDRLSTAGAKAIVLDLVFPGEREGDEVFAAALARHHDRVAIGMQFNKVEEDINADAGVVGNKTRLVPPTKALRPPPGQDSWLGFVDVSTDMDGLVRRVLYRTTVKEFAGIHPEDGDPEILSLAARGLEKAGFGDRIPTDHHSVLVRFPKNPLLRESGEHSEDEGFRPRSLHEIFVEDQWKAPPYNNGEFFRDKIVLIGAADRSSEDRLQTPFGTSLGVMMHLAALNAALNRDFLYQISGSANLAFILGGGVMAWLLGTLGRPVLRLVLLVLVALGYYAAAQFAFNRFGILPIFLSPLLVFLMSGFTWSAWEQVLDRVERQRIRRTLERYVSKDVVHEILDNPQSYLNSLGGVRKEITVLFSDVRSFTTLTETADPHALVTQLNEYFEDMVAIVFANHGTLDKFIGDAVMAHWGSIISKGPAIDTARAINTVLQMRQALAELNRTWRSQGRPEMRVGFGVNFGDAIVGNLGCEAKMEVSVIGDAVNLGSRLEGATKQYQLDVCIGEKAAALVKDDFILRSVDLIIVKGKTQPVEIFTVLDKRGAAQPTWLARHEEAMQLYRAGNFADAEKAWREVLAQAPEDGLAQTFVARCVELQANPPSGVWTGVYEMKTK